MLRRLARLLELKVPAVRDKVEERLESDPLTPVTIDTSVGELKTAYLMEHQGEFPGVQITETYLRSYEQGVLAPHILGYVGEIDAEQLEAKADQGYRSGDRIGKTGIEAVYDTYLRGVRGEGRVVRRRTRPDHERARVQPAARARRQHPADDRRRPPTRRRGGAGVRDPPGARPGRVGRGRGRARRAGREHRGDPRPGLQPDVRPEHLRRPRRGEGAEGARSQEREPPDAEPRRRRTLSRPAPRSSRSSRSRRWRRGCSGATSTSSAPARRSSTGRPSPTGIRTRTSR